MEVVREWVKTETLTYIHTPILVVEYVKLPVMDLSLRFLYRFVEPIPTAWQEGRFLLFDFLKSEELKFDDKLREFALGVWEEMTAECKDELPLPIVKVNAYECEIVRKS